MVQTKQMIGFMKEDSCKQYFDVAVREGLCFSKTNLKFYLDYVFKNISFDGKTMLDVGGGNGLFSFYAACMGAKKVICIEPETSGSKHGVGKKFRKIQSALGLNDKAELNSATIQEFQPQNMKFDVILFHDSINHCDEDACINLQNNANSVKRYKKIFRKISSMSNEGGKIIITDCSRNNFFAKLNIKNPFAPKVEWHKHQPPECWSRLLKSVGFHNQKVIWTSFGLHKPKGDFLKSKKLRSLVGLLIGNKIASYFLASHFRLEMEKRIE